MSRWLPCALLLASCGAKPPPPLPGQELVAWCKPGLACWPTPAEWKQLEASVGGRLEVPRVPPVTEQRNPFELQDVSGGTESTGWLGAWTAAPSAYAVVARTPEDIAAAVKFAAAHRLRLVVKGTGHDYLGRSSAADSLLIWTHEMRKITMHDAFVGTGCAMGGVGFHAVTVEAGTRWGEAYKAVTTEHGRYVQGGGCVSVGAAGGFLQGGGFGTYSKKFGTGAAGMLEAEVVTADGKRVIANACQNQDLFWALRGGGGGTFGVVTSVTLMTHALPSTVGLAAGSISANSDDAYKELLEHFLRFYGEHLSDEHWGDLATIRGDNTIALSLGFEGLTQQEVEQLWQPFRAWVDEHPDRFTMKLQLLAVPADKLWNHDFIAKVAPQAVRSDSRGNWWWATNEGEVSTYWYAYRSRWIPLDRFEGPQAAAFATTLFDASRHHPIELHFQKGQAGASSEALARDHQTSMNPAVYRAAALAIIADGEPAFPGVAGHEPDVARAEAGRAHVAAAAKLIRDATPGAGAYVNEADYFEPDWQHEFWGENYERLLAIKQKVDPGGLFYCHHCVGSERRGD